VRVVNCNVAVSICAATANATAHRFYSTQCIHAGASHYTLVGGFHFAVASLGYVASPHPPAHEPSADTEQSRVCSNLSGRRRVVTHNALVPVQEKAPVTHRSGRSPKAKPLRERKSIRVAQQLAPLAEFAVATALRPRN
jgi:hypothetical protein